MGDVASALLVKTRMAKSTLDAGWASLKTMLGYKSEEVTDSFLETLIELIEQDFAANRISFMDVHIPSAYAYHQQNGGVLPLE